MVNAQRLGHTVHGIASIHMDRQDLTMAAFEEIGVLATGGGRPEKHTKAILDNFQPDAVFGEQYWNCPEEVHAKKWARKNGAQHFALDHGKNYHSDHGPVIEHHRSLGPETTLLVATETARDMLRDKSWATIELVGQPQYDSVRDDWDIGPIRDRLGVRKGQKLIALSLTHGEGGEAWRGEGQYLLPLLDLAQQRGWKVVCSPHPTERRAVNELEWPKRASYLRSLQDQGVLFVSDFVPGIAAGVVFEQCSLLELLAACDGVLGSSETLGHPAYAVGKEYFCFSDIQWGPSPNVRVVKPGFSEFIDAVERGSPWEQDEETTRRNFYKLDGMVWKRILDLVKER